jgi:large subunit ribosomal protein L18
LIRLSTEYDHGRGRTLASKKIEKIRIKRKKRVRGKIFGTEARPRLSVFRSAKQIYAQAIADDVGKTLTEASTLTEEIKEKVGGLKKAEAAREVGMLVSKRLQSMGIDKVVFDRGRYLYHGRVKALAEAARESGLKF